jgi:hypothetical protein
MMNFAFMSMLPPSSRQIYEYTDKVDHIKVQKMEHDTVYQSFKLSEKYRRLTAPILNGENVKKGLERYEKEYTREKEYLDHETEYYQSVYNQFKSFSKSSEFITNDFDAVVNALVLFIVKKPNKAKILFQQKNIRDLVLTGIRHGMEGEIGSSWYDLEKVIRTLLQYNVKHIPTWFVEMTQDWLNTKDKSKSYYYDHIISSFSKKGLTLSLV